MFDNFMSFNYYRQQSKYSCGACAMRMVLECFGIKNSEKQLIKLLKTNKIRGTWLKEFPQLAEKLSLNYVVQRNSTIKDLKYFNKKGYKIIICYFYPPEKIDHYAVLKSLDSRYIHFYDPWFGPNHKYPLTYFKKIWNSSKRFEYEKAWFIAIKK